MGGAGWCGYAVCSRKAANSDSFSCSAGWAQRRTAHAMVQTGGFDLNKLRGLGVFDTPPNRVGLVVERAVAAL